MDAINQMRLTESAETLNKFRGEGGSCIDPLLFPSCLLFYFFLFFLSGRTEINASSWNM